MNFLLLIGSPVSIGTVKFLIRVSYSLPTGCYNPSNIDYSYLCTHAFNMDCVMAAKLPPTWGLGSGNETKL